jgi:hypothetical protein
MKPSLLILAAAAILVAGAAGTSALSAASTSPTPAVGMPRPMPFYGHITSIVPTRDPNRYRMQFDPAWWLSGVAGERACGCKPLSNDYYIVDETHRLLTFPVRSDARVLILVNHGTIGTASISVAELAQIVRGKNPKHRRLQEPKAGFWIRIGSKYPNLVISLDQQYQP